MLAALLLRAGEVVSVEALAAALWDDDPPPSARNTIQGYVRRLRDALGPLSSRVVTRAPGYLVEVRPGELDLHAFTGLRDGAATAAQAGEWDRAAELLAEALALWAGDPLLDVPSEHLRRTEVPGLTELRQGALEARIDAELRVGRPEEAIAELRGLVVAHPFRERLRELLMLALYRAGRQGEALSAYQQAREMLVDELGIEPGHRLQRLHRQILAADPALDGEEPDACEHREAPEGGPRGEAPRQLKAGLPDFTGRATQVRRLRETLLPPSGRRPGSVTVAAITGPGGIGKTTLALYVGHEVADLFPDGQLFLSLGGATSPVPPAELLSRLLRDLGVPDSGIPADEDERAARFRTLTADRTMLIVLDDAHSATQVRPLLPGSGDSAIIVTSRSTLADLPGCVFTELELLSAQESAALFTAIVGERRTSDDPEGINGIVASCAGLPLALRIAGSKLATQPRWTVGQLATLLATEHRRLGELATGDTAVRASFEVSYLSLPAGKLDPAGVFRMYGLSGLRTLSLPALAAMAGETVEQTAGSVAVLLDAHLLESPEPDRFQAHDLLRIYAAERAASDESDESRRGSLRRLFAWYQHTLNAAVREFHSGTHALPLEPLPASVPEPHVTSLAQALEWLQADHANLLRIVMIAADQHMYEDCWRLAWLMRHYLEWCGRWPEFIVVIEEGLRAAEACEDRAAVAALLNGLGSAHWKLGRMETATQYYVRSLELRRELSDQEGEAAVLSNLGLVEMDCGNAASAIERFTAALAINRKLEYRYGEAFCLHNLGSAHESRGQLDEALGYLEQALEIRVRHCPLNQQAGTLHSLGALLLTMGRTQQAMDHLRQSLSICQETRLRYGEGMTLASLGDGYQSLGRAEDALQAWREAYDILTEVGAPEAAAVRVRLAH